MVDFDYRAYFDRIENLKRILVSKDQVAWIEEYEKPTHDFDVVLYMGCNILRTPHIARQVVEVFEKLDLDFVAVGGVQFCCGIVWDATNGEVRGEGVSDRTIARVESYGSKSVVMWCPSCNVHFADTVSGKFGKIPDFNILHVTRFLADMVAAGEITWARPVNRRIAIHSHVGRDDHEEGKLRASSDRAAVIELLHSIPGLELVETINVEPEMDYDCGPAVFRMSKEEFRSHQKSTIERALALGVDDLVTISHACHREWNGISTPSLHFRNYITIVAEALGMTTRVDWLSTYRGLDDPQKIVDAGRLAWSSYGMSETEALAITKQYMESGELSAYAL